MWRITFQFQCALNSLSLSLNRKVKMSVINSNSVSLAGEFAVLSQLALRGYDANMTLGRTKGVDILVSNPKTGRHERHRTGSSGHGDGSGHSASCAYRDGRVFGCSSIAVSLSEHIDAEVAARIAQKKTCEGWRLEPYGSNRNFPTDNLPRKFHHSPARLTWFCGRNPCRRA